MTLTVVVIAAITLFVLSFASKRRYGVLGLALCAGALLHETLSIPLSGILDAYEMQLYDLPNTVTASLLLILVPSLLLLLGGPRYDTKKQAVIGSLGYTALALLLCARPLIGVLDLDETSRNTAAAIISFDSILIAVAVALAVFDMVLVHRPRIGRPRKH